MLFTPAPISTRNTRPALFTPATNNAPPSNAGNGTNAAPQPFKLTSLIALPTEMPSAAPVDESPSPGIMHAFSAALESWLSSGQADPTQVASHVPLLAEYEALIDREIAALEAKMAQPSSSATLAASLASEVSLLRGERSTWRLLRVLYSDYDDRQMPPPALPPPPEDWSADLRALGPAAPPLNNENIRKRAADADTTGNYGLSKGPADAGLHVRPLFDEAVLEARLVASDPLLDLGQRLQSWLAMAASERVRVREQDATNRNTRVRLEAALATRANFLSQRLGVSADLDGLLQAASQLGVANAESLSASQLAYKLVAALGATDVGDQASSLPSSLDPDAPFTEKRRLDPQDEAAQASLLHALWQLVRAGSVERAQELCRRCGQEWRAATLGGGDAWRYDPSKRDWVGNPERKMWREACDAISDRASNHREMKGSEAEAALYGALAGSMESLPRVLHACAGWEDTLWAHLNATLTTHLAKLTSHYSDLATAKPTPSPPPMRLPPSTLLSTLEHATSSEAADLPATRHHHQLQRRLVDLRVAELPPAAGGTPKHPGANGVVMAMTPPPAGGFGVGRTPSFDDGAGIGIGLGGPDAPPPKNRVDAAVEALLSVMSTATDGYGNYGPQNAPSARERAHLLRFAAHASLFVYLPMLRTRERSALPCVPAWRNLLKAYCGVLGEAAANLSNASKPGGGAAPTSALGFPTLFASDVMMGGPGAPLGGSGESTEALPTLDQMSSAVALVASNLQTESGMDDDLIVEVLSEFLARLPPELPKPSMAACLLQAHRLLDAPHLTPRITLRTVLRRHAPSLPLGGNPTILLSGAVAEQLQSVWWLMLQQELHQQVNADAIPAPIVWHPSDVAQLHHALTLTVLLVRRSIAASKCTADALLPPAIPPAAAVANATSEIEGMKVLVTRGTFFILEQRATDGMALIVHTPDADGNVGPPTTYAASALLAGKPAALPLALPCRVRLTLVAEDDTIVFKSEEVEKLPDSSQALESAKAAAHHAQQSAGVIYATEPPINAAVMETLQSRWIAAKAALNANGFELPLEAEQSMNQLLSELRLWWLFMKVSADQRGWQAAAAAKPLPNARGGSAGHSSWSEWREELHRRARRLASRTEELLKVKPESMGPLPKPEEVASLWGASGVLVAGGASADTVDTSVLGDGGAADQLRSLDGLMALRSAIVPGILRNLHTALIETGKLTKEPTFLHESFGLADLLADERYRLYECFEQEGLVEMLTRFRASALEMLSAS